MRTNLPQLRLFNTQLAALATVLLAGLVLPARAGVALKLEYHGITGAAVSSLTNHASFPGAPTAGEALVNGLTEAVNVAETFGAWTRGFIEAPQTGAYTFWIASDDDAQFWLSPNEQPSGLVKLAENVGAVGLHNYFAKPAQKSALFVLVAGRKYYFELLHKESTSVDFCTVAWTLPDGTFQEPIPDANLWPYPVDLDNPAYPPVDKAPAILSYYLWNPVTGLDPSGSTFVEDGHPLDLTITAEASQPAAVQWYSNGVALANASLLRYRIDRAGPSHNGAVYSVTVSNALGETSASTMIWVMPDTTLPTVVDALNLGNPAGGVAVVFSEAVDPASATVPARYTLSGGANVTSARMGSTPNVVILQTSGMAAGTSYTLTIANVTDLATPANVISPNPTTLPLDQNLHTWLRMDEATGVMAADASGNGRHAALTAGAMPGYTGKVLRALKFDGVGGHARAQDTYDDFSTNGLTVAVWANPTANLTSWARFIDYANGPASDNILFARSGQSADLTFEVYAGSNGNQSGGKVTAAGALILNQWQHVAATMDAGGNVVIYRNGVPVATGMTAVPNVLARTNNFWGRSNWGGDGYYEGRMDDGRLYSRVLDPAALQALAAGGGPDDNDPAVLPVSLAVTVPETALHNTPPGVFTITREGSTASPLTVFYVLAGTALNGVAYTNLPGSVTIPAGASSAQVFIAPIDFSFSELQQTVVLRLTGAANYTIGAPDAGTVTIQNNDVVPVATLATADTSVTGVGARTVDVWFAAAVANPSATNLANYALINAPGVSITNAALTATRNLRVVLSVSAPLPAGAQLSVTGVQDAGGNTAPAQIPIRLRTLPVNVVANVYHGTTTARNTAFSYVNNGTVNNVNNAGTGFDTWAGATTLTQFGGMLYAYPQDFQAIKVDLGRQFGDGGDWREPPKVYLLKQAVDTGSTRPEGDSNWVQVAAQLISGGQFQAAGWPAGTVSPNTPLVFDLTSLPLSERTGYGWAVGGVQGNGGNSFLSFSELRAYGGAGTEFTTLIAEQPQDRTVTEGQRTTFVQRSTNNLAALTYQWQRNGTNLSGATDVNYNLPPATLADDGALFRVIVSTTPGVFSITSQVARLTVLPRTNPPVVLAATLDPVNSVVDVWFDEPVDGNTAQVPSNFVINDPALFFYGALTNANGYCATLNYSGAPSVTAPLLTVSGVQDLFGLTLASQTVSVFPLVSPATNIVANQYQQGRDAAFLRSTDGLVSHDANVTTWTTFGGPLWASDFVGLGYATPQVFGVVSVDLGYQFGDGGNWSLEPRVFLLKRPVNTFQNPPETDPLNWVEVPARLLSGNVFNYGMDGPAGTPTQTPIAFSLAHLPPDQRTGYGWAVGGVVGDGPTVQFVSIAELRAYGAPVANATNAGPPVILSDVQPPSLTQPLGLPLTFSVLAAGRQPISYQWQRNGVNLADDTRISGAQSEALTIAETFLADAGAYRVILGNSDGSRTSAVANVTLTAMAFNEGGGWVLNRGPSIAGNVLELTQGKFNEARSAFLRAPAWIRDFTASFTYQDVGANGADGMVLVLQNSPVGPFAVGGAGGGLGFNGITPSAGIIFNIYGPNVIGVAFRANGATGTPYSPTTPVNFANGYPINVVVDYRQGLLTLTLTDTVTLATFTTSVALDLPTLLGGDTAYVGFTGATGAVASRQRISDFFFASRPAIAWQPAGGGTFTLSWPASAMSLVLQEAPDLSAPGWFNVAAPATLTGGQNRWLITPQPGNRFFRLSAP